jgi:hypothetical protein
MSNPPIITNILSATDEPSVVQIVRSSVLIHEKTESKLFVKAYLINMVMDLESLAKRTLPPIERANVLVAIHEIQEHYHQKYESHF